MRRAAALLAVATTSAIDWAAPGASRATLATLEGYPPPTCTCAATLEGSVDDVVDALLDPGTHHTWVSRLDESVVLAKDGAELVADADDAQVVYYRFALPFPCWDRQVSAALYCDRTEGGGARVELRRVSLPPPSEKPRRRRRKPKKRGDRVVGWTTAAAERFGPVSFLAPSTRRRLCFASTASSSHHSTRGVASTPSTRRLDGVELPAVDAQRERGHHERRAPVHLREPPRHRVEDEQVRNLISKHRFVLWAPPVLRNKVSRVRPNVEKQHGVVRSDCVTLPAFRVTYALQPRGAGRTRVELTLGADPGIPCPPWLIRWGLGHADRTLEALEATVTARAAEKALRRGKGRPAAARDPSVVLLSKRRPARPWRANPFRKRPPPPMVPAAFNFRP